MPDDPRIYGLTLSPRLHPEMRLEAQRYCPRPVCPASPASAAFVFRWPEERLAEVAPRIRRRSVLGGLGGRRWLARLGLAWLGTAGCRWFGVRAVGGWWTVLGCVIRKPVGELAARKLEADERPVRLQPACEIRQRGTLDAGHGGQLTERDAWLLQDRGQGALAIDSSSGPRTRGSAVRASPRRRSVGCDIAEQRDGSPEAIAFFAQRLKARELSFDVRESLLDLAPHSHDELGQANPPRTDGRTADER